MVYGIYFLDLGALYLYEIQKDKMIFSYLRHEREPRNLSKDE